MSNYTWDQFDEIFGTGEREMLGRSLDNRLNPTKAIIELTLNFPRTAKFKRMSVERQKQLYDGLIYFIMLRLYRIGIACTYERTFETCKSGFIHIHAILDLVLPVRVFCPHGLICDIVSAYLYNLPGKHSRYNDKFYRYDLNRFRSPSICCQYRNPTEVSRIDCWKQYINKFSVPPIYIE